MVRPGKLTLMLMGGMVPAGGGAAPPAVDGSSGMGGAGVRIGSGVTSPEQAGRYLMDGCTVELAEAGKLPNPRFFYRYTDGGTAICIGRRTGCYEADAGAGGDAPAAHPGGVPLPAPRGSAAPAATALAPPVWNLLPVRR